MPLQRLSSPIFGKSSSTLVPHSSLPLMAILLASLLYFTNAQLYETEKAALNQIFNAFPALASIPHWEQDLEDNNFYGRSWTNNFDDLCRYGNGYDFYGVFCNNGHISGLRVTPYWGYPKFNDFSLVTGLTELRNFSYFTAQPIKAPDFYKDLAQSIIDSMVLEHLEVPDIPVIDVFDPSSLVNLTVLDSPAFNYSIFPNLRSLTVSGPSMSTFHEIHPNLEEINFPSARPIVNALDRLQHFPSLRVLRGAVYSVGSQDFISASFENLRIFVLNINSVNVEPSFSIRSDTLEYFSAATANVTLFTPNLKELESGLVNFSSTPMPFLTSISLTPSPYFDYVTQLSELSNVICYLLNMSANIHTLKVDLDTFTSLPPPTVPSCLQNTNLQTLELAGFAIDQTFFQFAPRTLSQLYLGDLNFPVLVEQFLQFPNLRELIVIDPESTFLHGTIPPNFFLDMKQLETIRLTGNLSGEIPSVGWANLERVTLVGEDLEWPTLDTAPRLKVLLIGMGVGNLLPSEEDFMAANMDTLEVLQISGRSSEKLPLPLFWTSFLKIYDVSLRANWAESNFPKVISAPKLETLYITQASLCGPLPQFTLPRHMKQLTISGNQFSGSIPSSWGTGLRLHFGIDLRNNLLNGTIPPNFLSHFSLQMRVVGLGGNFFEGTLGSLPVGASLLFSPSNLDVCQNMQTVSPPKHPVCDFSSLSSCPTSYCNTSWYQLCETVRPCSERNLTLPSLPNCPLRIVTAPPNCPLPQPEGFVCRNVQWVSLIPISVPSISFPPNLGTIIIKGNFSTLGPVTFSGIGTTLLVDGCVQNLGQVTIEISPDNLPGKSTIIQQKGTNCAVDLSLIQIQVKSTKKSCENVKASSSESTPSALVAVFTLDKSKCSTKWITIGSALGALVLLGVGGILLLKHFKFRVQSLK